jgi:hypothetical protein
MMMMMITKIYDDDDDDDYRCVYAISCRRPKTDWPHESDDC